MPGLDPGVRVRHISGPWRGLAPGTLSRGVSLASRRLRRHMAVCPNEEAGIRRGENGLSNRHSKGVEWDDDTRKPVVKNQTGTGRHIERRRKCLELTRRGGCWP
jgi:hypothetical protein